MNNPADTNQASELYELCKKVYELTDWDGDSIRHALGDEIFDRVLFESDINETHPRESYLPLYTSDYLLEKLPVHLKEGTLSSLYELDEDNRPWCWGYHYDDRRVQLPNGHYAQGWHDTPLKALLKLTITLSEAGELDNDQSS